MAKEQVKKKEPIKELTPELEAKIPVYIKRALNCASDGQRLKDFNFENARNTVLHNYKLCNFTQPRVVVAANLYEGQLLFDALKSLQDSGNMPKKWQNMKPEGGITLEDDIEFNEFAHNVLKDALDKKSVKTNITSHNFSFLYTMSVYADAYYQWFRFIKDELNLDSPVDAEFEEIFALQQKSGIFAALFAIDICVVCKYPKSVRWNEQNQLHNPGEAAIAWSNTYPETKYNNYIINGRTIKKRWFEEPFTIDDFIKTNDEEERAAMFSIVESRGGEGAMLEFLNAEKYATKDIVHANGDTETLSLYKTKNRFQRVSNSRGESNQPLAWLELICPSTGTRYLLNTFADFTDPEVAAKWHRPATVPLDVPYSWACRS